MFAISLRAQENPGLSTDTALANILNRRFKGGESAFLKYMGNNLRYPPEAMQHCRLGIVLVALKLRPSGDIDSVLFKNEVKFGMGIEDEILRVLLMSRGKWIKSETTTIISFSIAFQTLEEQSSDATIIVIGYEMPQGGCPTDKALIKNYEKYKKKDQYKELKEVCEDLIRRMPKN
ncbi:MAG: hypothetical protein WCJ44_34555, partial [Runella sp.]